MADTVRRREMKFLALREMGETPKRSGRRERDCFLVKIFFFVANSSKQSKEIHDVMIENTHVDISQCTL